MTGPGGARAAVLPDGYEFVRFLGSGAGGWVALATQLSVGRSVAVKTVTGGARDLDAVGRLRREGRALAGLRHPAIVTVFDLLVTDSDIALVMEYLSGGTLRGRMDDGSLSRAEQVVVLGDITSALLRAGEAGIAHRDVKPANILLRADGHAKLADFGLARLPRWAGAFRTAANQATGTPLYMAPEQIVAPDFDSPLIDHYAFAVLAYQMLVGAYPYDATTVTGVLRAHQTDAPTAPRWHVAGFPQSVADALIAGMSKSPTHRAGPDEIMRAVTSIPLSQWDELPVAGVVTTPSRSVSAPIEPTAAADGAATDGPAPGAPQRPAPPQRQPAPAPAPKDLYTLPVVTAPVFVADRGTERRPRRSGPRLIVVWTVVGFLVGLIIAFVAVHR